MQLRQCRAIVAEGGAPIPSHTDAPLSKVHPRVHVCETSTHRNNIDIINSKYQVGGFFQNALQTQSVGFLVALQVSGGGEGRWGVGSLLEERGVTFYCRS